MSLRAHVLAAGVLGMSSGAFAAEPLPIERFPPPSRFEDEIVRFECADLDSAPAPGGIVCTGSSSMVFWKDRLATDLAPLRVIPRGFGGSTMYDLWWYLERVVLKYEPRAIVVYEGDNDIAAGATPGDVRAVFDAIVIRIHERLPNAHVWVLSVKPSPARWAIWPAMAETNERLRAACAVDERLHWVDVASAMLGPDGTPIPKLFLADRLHLNARGYDLWAAILAPRLLAQEARFEEAPVIPPPVR